MFTLDPDADLDYQFDWTDWLQSGETISTYTVTTTAGVTKHNVTHAAGVVTVWLKNGVSGAAVTVTCEIVTSAGRTDDRSFPVRVAQR